jgi:hypothetical protein
MMAALAWKEYREHRAVWLTMAAVACLGLLVLDRLTDGGDKDLVLGCVGLLMVWGYGLVCGAMLLAGEREDGTLPFLDGLPCFRRRLWLAKCLIGVGLVLAQTAVLIAVAAELGVLSRKESPDAIVVGFPVLGITGLGWGLLFSASGSNVLRVIGQAIGAQVLVGFGLLLLESLLVFKAPSNRAFAILGLGNIGLTVLTFVGSWRTFCRSDRQRHVRACARERSASGRVLLWLCWQQARSFALVLLLCSVAAGLLVMTEGTIVWPAATLLVGVVCGVTVFADEQSGGAFRFLGDQRLPPGRIWLFKTGVRLALAFLAALLIVVLSVVRSVLLGMDTPDSQGPRTFLAWLFRDAVLGEVAAPGAFLILWLLHGFGIGQLCGLLVRKSVVAVFLALGASAVAASVWLPSLLGGGLHVWQVAGVPAVALAASGLLLPAWTAGRLSGTKLAGGVAAAVGAAVLWLAAAIGYRVAEIPDTPDLLDMPAFLAELPAPGQNEAGRLTRSACDGLKARLRELGKEQPTKPLFPPAKKEAPAPERQGDPGGFRPPAQFASKSFEGQAGEVLERGWPGGEPELGAWLDRVFADRWPGELARAAALPAGVVEDPRRMTLEGPRDLGPAHTAGTLLAARGLREQARGDAAVFVADLRTGLALSRNLRNHSVHFAVQVARANEERLLMALDRWLERLHGRPDLLREALAILGRHEALVPDDPIDTQRAEFLVTQNTLEHPEWFLALNLAPANPRSASPALIAAVGVAWQVPWERERQQRLLRLLFADNPSGRQVVLRAVPWMRHIGTGVVGLSSENDRRRELTALRARQLEVALRLYQAEKGKPAAALEALVPGILPEIPLDPFSSRPFRYRLSAGERIEWPSGNQEEPQVRQVPAGQGILWSVGPDGRDDSGRSQGSHAIGRQGNDLIFLVPLPPKH